MYQVVLIYGENEPWWFFDEWEEDIVDKKEFTHFDEAEKFFEKIKTQLIKQYEHIREKTASLIAFWNEDEVIYCEDCDEDLQAYKGLMLLKDYQKLNNGDLKTNETANHSGKTQCSARHS